MGFNYGLEKKRFDAEWARLRKEYAEAGMDAWAIEEMYKFDLHDFRRRRNAARHEQNLADFQDADGEAVAEDRSPLLLDFLEKMTVTDTYSFCEKQFAWLDTVSDEKLYRKLLSLQYEDKELLTMIFEYELSNKEIATLRGISVQAVWQKIKRLKNFLSDV